MRSWALLVCCAALAGCGVDPATLPARRSAIPVMHPGRVDVIAAGALVLRAVVARTGLDAVVASERDILDGIAWSLAD